PRAHLRESLRGEQPARCRRERAVDRDEVAVREHLVDGGYVRRAERALDRRFERRMLCVEYMHAESPRTACDGAPDAAEAHDAERRSVDARAEEEGRRPSREA